MNPDKIPRIVGLEKRHVVYLSLSCLQMEMYLANCNLLGQMFVILLCTHGSAYDNKYKGLKSFTNKHDMFVKSSPHYGLAIPVLDTDLLKELKDAAKGMIYVEDGYGATTELIRSRAE